MSRSTDAGHFFQTDSALSESARKVEKSKNEAGSPIRLPSKILAILADLYDDGAVYIAEAAGLIKRVILEIGEISHTFRPNTTTPAPLTCLAISPSRDNPTLFAGSWDKSIYAWPLSKRTLSSSILSSKSVLSGHTDFIKALITIPAIGTNGTSLLISGSSDTSIIVWNAETLQALHTLTGHSRAVQALALDPLSLPEDLSQSISKAAAESTQAPIIFSGDSNREIRSWRVSPTAAFEVSAQLVAAGDAPSSASNEPVSMLLAHETSVFGLDFSSSGDLWTASADKTAKCLSRAQNFASDTSLQHPDFVRAVAVEDGRGLVVTACRDENVRVWETGTGKCIAVLEGHWEEVTGLALVEGGKAVTSVSIDGTLRKWPLGIEELKKIVEVNEDKKKKEEEEEEEKKPKSMLTEDEERELAELMGDDSD